MRAILKNGSVAGIVVFNPDIERLNQNIAAIKPQVKKVIIIENGSKDLSYKDSIQEPDVEYINNGASLGIAHALNQILEFAESEQCQWALTLDQDSVAADNLIETLGQYASDEIGIVCPKIKDRQFSSIWDDDERPFVEINACITSGSLTSVKAWRKCGGFDEQMFIDWVDFDFCYSIQSVGYKIVRVNGTHILHELGAGTKAFHIGKHQYIMSHRSSMRIYYIFRNYVYLYRKFHKISFIRLCLILLRWTVFTLYYDKPRVKNMITILKGIKDGVLMKISAVPQVVK